MPRLQTRRGCRAAALAAAFASTAALAAVALQDFPKLRSGLWEMTTTVNNVVDVKTKSTLCLDASIQQEMIRIATGAMAGMCSKSEIKVAGNQFVSDAVCNVGGSTMRSKAVMTITGDTSYRTTAQATFDPPLGGQARSNTVIDGRHIGACKPGQRPGDLTTPTGQTINIRNVMSGKK